MRILNIQIDQTGYAYGVSFAKNILFFKYSIINKVIENYNDFISIYTDMDLGNISGGAPEYGNDKINFIKEKNFVYFYDNGHSEWPGGKMGLFGVDF